MEPKYPVVPHGLNGCWAKSETNIITGNSSYGIDGHVNSNKYNNNNNLYLRAILKIKFPFSQSVLLTVSILLLLLNRML
jgi:hypothetical protein